MTKKTLVLAYPGCILFEVMLATELLHPAYPVSIATPNGEPLINSNGMKVRADMGFQDIQVADCACLLVPGGDPTEAMENSDIDTVLQNAHAQNLWIGGVCGGVLVLAKTGILQGRSITHTYTERYASLDPELIEWAAPYWKKTHYVDQLVVVDGAVITAMPFGYIDFAVTLAHQLGIYSAEKA
ncbi:MAG: DJ-1/PfpI family protein [Kovacikia sp.]